MHIIHLKVMYMLNITLLLKKQMIRTFTNIKIIFLCIYFALKLVKCIKIIYNERMTPNYIFLK